MDSHDNNHQQPISSSVDALQDGGIYANHFDHLYADQPSNGFDSSNWNFVSADNAGTHQPLSLYSDWRHSPATHNDIVTHGGQPMPRSPSLLQQSRYNASTNNYDHIRESSQSRYQHALYPSPADPPQYTSGLAHSTTIAPTTTIAPQALENDIALTSVKLRPQEQHSSGRTPDPSSAAQSSQNVVSLVDQGVLVSAVPPGLVSGIFSIIDYDRLVSATTSKRINGFVNVGQSDFEYPVNRAALPTPLQRRSRNEIRRSAGDDPKLIAKLGKKATKKASVVAAISKDFNKPQTTKLVQTPAGIKHEVVSLSDESSSEEDSSDYDSEDDEPSPLPAKRPDDDPREAVKYDSIKALWRGKKSGLASSEIRNGLKDYWEVVRTIRDIWKADTAAVIVAEEKNRKGELPLLRSRVKDQLTMIEIAFKAAMQHGHRSILELSGENAAFLFLCYQFLLDRHKQNDLDGPLSQAILGVLALCTTLTEEKLAKPHLIKVLPRFGKKGNAETQALVKKIEDAAKEGSKNSEEAKPATVQDQGSPMDAQSPSTSKVVPESVVGVKRSAPAGNSSAQPAKRLASATGSQAVAKPVAKAASSAAKKVVQPTGARPAISMTSTPPVPKTKTAATKPSGFFAGMQSGVKKTPAAVNAKPAVSSVVASTLKSLGDPAPEKAATTTAAKPSFSFANTIANLQKPKADKATTPKVEKASQPAENAEQRRKRLRKEARRGLRVSFKPESNLVEVRYFTHDPEEEAGHDASMTRDVADVGGEGRMFKQHKELMEADDDDDGPGEEEVKPYKEPGLINFDDVDKEERERNFVPYGGGEQKPESAEMALRDQYERETLMAIYATPGDIPPSPKEPAEDMEVDGLNPAKTFGAPAGVAAERAARFARNAVSHQAQQSAPVATPDIAAILASFNNPSSVQQQQQQQQQPQPLPLPQPAQSTDQMSALQNILAKFSQPADSQAVQAVQANQPTQHTPSPAPADLASIFANLQPQGSNVAINQLQAFQPQESNASAPNLAALFALIGQGSGPQAAAQTQQPQQGQQQGQQYPYENEERRRWRDAVDDGESGQQQQQKKKGGWADKRFTQPCKYWPIGRCQKGDQCTYLHT